MSDFKHCEGCRFLDHAPSCCKHFYHCRRIAELESALRDLWAFGDTGPVGKTYCKIFRDKYPHHRTTIESVMDDG